MPQRSFDHVVLAVRDLDAAAERFRALGFTLTPRAEHAWGTTNHLAQFAGRCFIEILTVDRPELLARHVEGLDPEAWDFGRHNRDFLAKREGASILVMSGSDSRADAAAFASYGGHPPFDFERQATLPDGSHAKVAFSLAFASDPALPDCGFFTCHNRFPEVFWKPDFQAHANGTQTMTAVVMAAPDPARHEAFLETFTGRPAEETAGGLRFPLASGQELLVLEPSAVPAHFPGQAAVAPGPHFFGIRLRSDRPGPAVTPAAEACGLAIAWERP